MLIYKNTTHINNIIIINNNFFKLKNKNKFTLALWSKYG